MGVPHRPANETGDVMKSNFNWLEVWIDSSTLEYVLLVRQTGDNGVEVVDPQDRCNIVATFEDYDEAVHWLNEDEYDLIEGRHYRTAGAS